MQVKKQSRRKIVAQTHDSNVLGGLGGFGAEYEFGACWRCQPVLISATDGVGTSYYWQLKLINWRRGMQWRCTNDVLAQELPNRCFLTILG